MKCPVTLLALALCGLAACDESPSAPNERPSLAAGGSSSSYAALFADSPADMLRSDGRGTYLEGVDCVNSAGGSAGGGLYQLRTIAGTTACKAVQRPGWRWFSLDLGAPLIDFDQDGIGEGIEDAPARMLAANAFAQGATSTPVRILIMKVNPNGSTEWDTIWELRYRSPVAVSGTGTRVIQAAAGNPVDVYAGAFAKGAQPIATIVSLPFTLTLTPQ